MKTIEIPISKWIDVTSGTVVEKIDFLTEVLHDRTLQPSVIYRYQDNMYVTSRGLFFERFSPLIENEVTSKDTVIKIQEKFNQWVKSQKNISSECVDLVNKHFWDLI